METLVKVVYAVWQKSWSKAKTNYVKPYGKKTWNTLNIYHKWLMAIVIVVYVPPLVLSMSMGE